jgi:uncharacterized Zn-finger protein
LFFYNYKFYTKTKCNYFRAGDEPAIRKTIFKCLYCALEFPTLKAIKRHVEIHKNEKHCSQHKCSQCSDSFPTVSALRQHLRASHKRLSCPMCHKMYFEQRDLQSHLLLHRENLYNCTQCSEVFPTALAQKKHQKKSHPITFRYACPTCHKIFKEKSNLVVHIRIHSGLRPFKCTECAKSFHGSDALKRHMRTHTGEKPYICTECGKAFRGQNNLKQHMRIHTGEKPFQCPDCPKLFSRPDHLRNHSQVHSKERPFLCLQCGKTFKGLKALKLHEKMHIKTHKKEKPFSCSECGKSFDQSITLREHMETHFGTTISAEEKTFPILSSLPEVDENDPGTPSLCKQYSYVSR